MTPFDKAAQAKFDKGALDHPNQEWETLDERAEVMDELLDMFWYSGKLKERRDVIQAQIGTALERMAKGYWEQLYDTLPKNKRIAEAKAEAGRNMFTKMKEKIVG